MYFWSLDQLRVVQISFSLLKRHQSSILLFSMFSYHLTPIRRAHFRAEWFITCILIILAGRLLSRTSFTSLVISVAYNGLSRCHGSWSFTDLSCSVIAYTDLAIYARQGSCVNYKGDWTKLFSSFHPEVLPISSVEKWRSFYAGSDIFDISAILHYPSLGYQEGLKFALRAVLLLCGPVIIHRDLGFFLYSIVWLSENLLEVISLQLYIHAE